MRTPSPAIRKRSLAVALLAIALLGAGCGSGSEAAGTADAGGPTTAVAEPVPLAPVARTPVPDLPTTVESDDGRTVEVTDVSRIVPLYGNISEVVFALGLGANVVGRDITATFPEAEDLPLVTRSHDVSAESVLSLRPTLVLAQEDSGPPEAIDQIRSAGVPVLFVHSATTIDGIADRIHQIAGALGVPAEGDGLAVRTMAQIEAVRDQIPADVTAPKVAFLYMRGQAGVYLIAGPGSGADAMIQAAGGIDAGTASGLDKSFTPITSEALVKAAPDVILMTTTGLESVGGVDGLVTIPGIAQTPAGRDRRVVTVEDGLLYSFGSRTAIALEELITQLYGAQR